MRGIAAAAAVAALAGMVQTEAKMKELQAAAVQAAKAREPEPTLMLPPKPADPNAAFRGNADPKANEPPGGIKLTRSSYVPEPQPGETPRLTTTMPITTAPTSTTGETPSTPLMPPPIWQPPMTLPQSSLTPIGSIPVPWLPRTPLAPSGGCGPLIEGGSCGGAGNCK